MPDPTLSEWSDRQPAGAEAVGLATWSLADHLEDMVSAHAPDGTYRYASAASRHLLGYEPEELIGTDCYAYFHPDDIDKVALSHRSALSGAPFMVAYRLRRKSGEYVWVETTNKVINDEHGEGVAEIVCCTRAIGHRRAEDFEREIERPGELSRIERVLAGEQIQPVFQPIFDLDSMGIVALEALARFPGNSAHTPERWFSDAWELGLGVPLELHAARQATEILSRLGRDVALFVNASPPVVAAPGFLQALGEQIDRVTVEVTEHLRVDDYGQLGLELSAFRGAGGQLAIDDFGAGFASFRHIVELRPQWIKLDRSLIAEVPTSDVARGLAQAVAAFAGNVGVKVVAEGIETAEELESVCEIGITHGQGFFLGRPMTADRVLELAGGSEAPEPEAAPADDKTTGNAP